MFLTTKLPPGDAGRERQTLCASLRALGTDYVDLWLVHWPPAAGPLVPMWREFLTLRDEGMTRAVGVATSRIAQIDELIQATGEAPAVNQIPWSPARYEAALLAASRERQVVVEGYSPLKGTNLADPVLAEIAARHRVTPGPGRAALAPRARHPGHPEVGPSGPDQGEHRPARLLAQPGRGGQHRQPARR